MVGDPTDDGTAPDDAIGDDSKIGDTGMEDTRKKPAEADIGNTRADVAAAVDELEAVAGDSASTMQGDDTGTAADDRAADGKEKNYVEKSVADVIGATEDGDTGLEDRERNSRLEGTCCPAVNVFNSSCRSLTVVE